MHSNTGVVILLSRACAFSEAKMIPGWKGHPLPPSVLHPRCRVEQKTKFCDVWMDFRRDGCMDGWVVFRGVGAGVEEAEERNVNEADERNVSGGV